MIRTDARERPDSDPAVEDNPTPLTREEVAEIVRLMRERRRYRLKAIAARFGRSVTTIRRVYARYTERSDEREL